MTARVPTPRLRVRTLDIVYLIDLEESWVADITLRRDAERFAFAGLARSISLGHPMLLVLVREIMPGQDIIWQTTPVVEIAPVERG